MADLTDLYQQVILDHNRNPRNFGPLPGANRQAEGHNPNCGDHITLCLKLDREVISDIRFQGSGCAISRASASLMTAAVKGKSRPEVQGLMDAFQALMTADPTVTADSSAVGKLGALAGVRQFPMRVKCATLPWHALKAALVGGEAPVSTE